MAIFISMPERIIEEFLKCNRVIVSKVDAIDGINPQEVYVNVKNIMYFTKEEDKYFLLTLINEKQMYILIDDTTKRRLL